MEAKKNISEPKVARLDASSFQMLYDSYAAKMYRICYREVQDEELAGDIVHNVFLSIWERRDTLVMEHPESFLIHAAKIQILKFFRDSYSKKAHLELSLKDYSEADTSTLQLIYFNDLSEQVIMLVDQLPPQCRRVYLMRDQEGLTNLEIAAQLGISVSAVKQHIGNALAFLRKNVKS